MGDGRWKASLYVHKEWRLLRNLVTILQRVRVFQGQAEKGSGVCPEWKNPWVSGLWRWGGAIKHHAGIQVGTVQCGIRVL